MSITGHKSLNSLAIYQKVLTDEKLSMAYAMSCYLEHEKTRPLAIQNPPNASISCQTTAIVSASSESVQDTSTAIVPTVNMMTQAKARNEEKQLVPYENEDPFSDVEIPDFDLGQIMDTIKKENTISMTQTAGKDGSTTTNIQQRQFYQKRSPQIPIFNNCKIGNINIAINKK